MEKIGKSFDTLALAATVKSDTIEALSELISDPNIKIMHKVNSRIINPNIYYHILVHVNPTSRLQH